MLLGGCSSGTGFTKQEEQTLSKDLRRENGRETKVFLKLFQVITEFNQVSPKKKEEGKKKKNNNNNNNLLHSMTCLPRAGTEIKPFSQLS